MYFLASAGSLFTHLDFVLVGSCLAVIIWLYYHNNPLHHGRWFMTRRLINWLPLGMTYAFLYMGRYNLAVSKTAMNGLMSNQDFGWIFAAGTWTYALSFLVNGPLVDRIGGKKGILIAAIGSSVSNVLLGVLTYLVLTNRLKVRLVVAYSLLYSANMYFQSYGAVSIIKVKAYWFHVRERGVFGAIFGTLISFGVYFAFDWGQAIVKLSKAHPQADAGPFRDLFAGIFASKNVSVDATWAVFFIPAVIMLFWAALDFWLIKDTPEEANFPHLDTHDASSGQMHIELSRLDLLKKVFTSPLMLLVACVELTSGVFRNGIMQWYLPFAKQVKQPGSEFFANHWGLLLCIFGIIGGFAGGLISDKVFHSRRGPPAGLLCGFILVMALVMTASLFSNAALSGISAISIVMAGIGITSLMSGTAATDFGGRKATATCSGIVDGFAYLGSGLQSACLGYITTWNWQWWPVFFIPFAILGLLVAIKIWHELPAATRKYLAEVERKPIPELAFD